MGSTPLKRELGGIALALFAVFLTGALVLQSAAPPGATCASGPGIFGPAGSCLRAGLVTMLGLPASLLLPLIPLAYALRLFGRAEPAQDSSRRSWLGFLGALAVVLPPVIALARRTGRDSDELSGLWGSFIAFYLTELLGPAGAWIVLLLVFSALTAALLAWNPLRVLLGPSARRSQASDVGAGQAPRALLLEPAPEEMPAMDRTLLDNGAPGVSPVPGKPTSRVKRNAKGTGAAVAQPSERASANLEEADGFEVGLPDESADELPPADLLTPASVRNVDQGRRELDAAGVKLMEALRTFRVEGELVGRTTGPTVTQFEIEPAPGVKVRQFANLANDLALAMRAQSIRVVAPIPGRGAVGVEVPNPVPEIVAFRDLLESSEYQQARAALPIALGKDLEGKPVIADLAKMPHLLIAGATGSGKSVCVNTIITSLVYRHTKRTLRLLMVDPKMVELSVYNDLPHLRHKVVTDNRDAAGVLKWAVQEMQERYELLAANGCRNIQDFNRRHQEGAQLRMPKRPDVAFEESVYTGEILPYIVVVIDEMADLMMTVQAEIETKIALLAQKARAIGIHLILATQRPSVNVITGLIKANFPSRIAFRVASQVDSRTIIDGAGAEMLLGNGDMLFIPPGKSEPARLQGAFISSEDTERLIRWFREGKKVRRPTPDAHGAAVEPSAPEETDILEMVRARELEEAGSGEEEPFDGVDRDRLFREAAECVIQNQGGSTSLLQRRLRIGYGRAARILDQLQLAGVLGPPDGSKPRDVLMGLEDLDRICGPRD